MYKIYADDTLIYDSTFEDYRIGKGQITIELNKSGSFVFSVYPDHVYFDKFVRMKTIITVFKSEKIIFRGRILNDVTDYWNNKVITCEGELGFFQDSIIRPFEFSGTPEQLFRKFVNEHNSQVDAFKRFKIGTITVVDGNNYVARSNEGYESTLQNLRSRLLESALGGNLYITHGEDGTDPVPTLNYLADFTDVSTQPIEFGSNLKDYTKTVKSEEIATVIIPLGAEVGEAGSGEKLTIKSVNNGLDYVSDKTAVNLYGKIVKMIEWDDVTDASNLKKKAEAYVRESAKQNVTIELTAVDLHLLDRSIESFKMGDYIPVFSVPHDFDEVMLCNKQTIDLLKPDNDTVTLGYTVMTFTEKNSKILPAISKVKVMESAVQRVSVQVAKLDETVKSAEQMAQEALESYQDMSLTVETITNNMQLIADAVTKNEQNIFENANSIRDNRELIEKNSAEIINLANAIQTNANAIEEIKGNIFDLSLEMGELDQKIVSLSNTVTQHTEDITNVSNRVSEHDTKIEDILTRLEELAGSQTEDIDGGYPS